MINLPVKVGQWALSIVDADGGLVVTAMSIAERDEVIQALNSYGKAEKYDMALSTTATLQLENNELRKGRDDLKKALGECILELRFYRDYGTRPGTWTMQDITDIQNQYDSTVNTLAAAEKLLEEDDVTDEAGRPTS